MLITGDPAVLRVPLMSRPGGDAIQGDVILIAGALGPVALAMAEDFRARGASVLVDGDPGDPAAFALKCDAIAAQHGRLDLVVFCSGTALPPEAKKGPLLPAPEKPAALLRRWGARLMGMLSRAGGRRWEIGRFARL